MLIVKLCFRFAAKITNVLGYFTFSYFLERWILTTWHNISNFTHECHLISDARSLLSPGLTW